MSLLEELGFKQAPSRQFYDDDNDENNAFNGCREGVSVDFSKQPPTLQPTTLFPWQWHPLPSSSSPLTNKPLIIGESVMSNVMLTFIKACQLNPIATCTLTYEKTLDTCRVEIHLYYFEDHVWLPFSSTRHPIPMELYTPLHYTLTHHLSPSSVVSFTSVSGSGRPEMTYLSNHSIINHTCQHPESPSCPSRFAAPQLLTDFTSTFMIHHPISTSKNPACVPCTLFIAQVSRTLGQPDLDACLDSSWKWIFHHMSLSKQSLGQWIRAVKTVRQALELASPIYI